MSEKVKIFRQLTITESLNPFKKLKMDSNITKEKTRILSNKRELLPGVINQKMTLSTSNTFLKDIDEDLKQEIDNENRDEIGEKTDETCPKSSPLSTQLDETITYSDELFQEIPSSEELFSSEEINLPGTSNNDEKLSSQSNHSSALFSENSNNCEKEQTSLSLLNRTPACCLELAQLSPSQTHSIMFSTRILPGMAPLPYPKAYTDKWDTDHVRMPCSPQSQFPLNNEIQNRWELINRSLRREINSSIELEHAIMLYNRAHSGKWDFQILHTYINQHLSTTQKQHFFKSLLPSMITMACQLPHICTKSIPLLKKHKTHSLTLSQKQIGCLLLNAFFCTFPRRNSFYKLQGRRENTEYASYPDINFTWLFGASKYGNTQVKIEKLHCLFNYFQRIIDKEPTGTVTFRRQYLQDLPKWNKSQNRFRTTVIKADGLIEKDGYGMLQVDFANKFIGGGVFKNGCVQEEIRFLICPELIVSRLFVECLDNTEALIITGVEQYNKYSGYSCSFKWEGNFIDHTERDAWGRRYTQIVAIDALYFRQPDNQFNLDLIKRELNKAFCGFYEEAPPEYLSAVATGNWGCGAFKGSPYLKFLIQLMAASQIGRDMLYLTFNNVELQNSLIKMYNFIIEKNLSIGDLWQILTDYSYNVMKFKKKNHPQLFDYIYYLCSEETDDTMKNKSSDNINNGDENCKDSNDLDLIKMFENP